MCEKLTRFFNHGARWSERERKRLRSSQDTVVASLDTSPREGRAKAVVDAVTEGGISVVARRISSIRVCELRLCEAV